MSLLFFFGCLLDEFRILLIELDETLNKTGTDLVLEGCLLMAEFVHLHRSDDSFNLCTSELASGAALDANVLDVAQRRPIVDGSELGFLLPVVRPPQADFFGFFFWKVRWQGNSTSLRAVIESFLEPSLRACRDLAKCKQSIL